MNQKEINSQKRFLKLELQGVNHLITEFFLNPNSKADITELAERKRTLLFQINNPIANPFYCFIKS